MKCKSEMRKLTKIVLIQSLKLAAVAIIKCTREDNIMAIVWINILISKLIMRR